MEYVLSKQFVKDFSRLPKPIRGKALIALKKFLNDHTKLDLRAHPLSGEWRGFYSIDVTGDIRAVYTFTAHKKVARFVAIGSHSKLYR